MYGLLKVYFDTKLWIIVLIIGLMLCFLGNQIFLPSLFVFGFLALAMPGFLIGSQGYGMPGGILGLILCGLGGGILFIALYQVGLFGLGFLVGGVIGLIVAGELLLAGGDRRDGVAALAGPPYRAPSRGLSRFPRAGASP